MTVFSPTVRAETDFGQVAIYVAHMLENTHYSKRVFDNEMSAKVLESYLNALDPRHNFFTQADVDGFRAAYKDGLDDAVMLRDISPALKIYDVYRARIKERVAYAQKLLKEEKFTFDSDRTVDLKREKLPWPKDKAEADALWHDLVEAEMLQEVMNDEAKARDKAKRAAEKTKADAAKPKGDSSASEPAKDGDKPKDKEGDAKPSDAGAAPEVEETPAERVAKDYVRLLQNLDANDNQDVANTFLTCLATSYDPHTEYMSPSEMDSFNSTMKHELFGIGAMLQLKDDVAEIQGIVVGGPADKQGGLALNDKVVGVAQGDYKWVDTKYLRLQKIVDMIRGKEGSTVNLRIVPASAPGTTREISIVRGKVSLKDKVANAELLESPESLGGKTRLGWINLSSFYADMDEGKVSTTADVERLLRRLIKENIEGLVLDLRGNGGGSLEEAIRLTGLFVPAGPVVQVKDWREEINFRECTSERPVYDGPMIVLTDKASASASEIVAAALQDYRRAIIIGDHSTYGKGTVQTIQPVRNFMPFFSEKEGAGNLKVTIQKFYRIAGGSTQLKGVIPDLNFPSLRDAMDFGEASQKNALPYDEIPALPFSYSRRTPFPVDALKTRLLSRVKNNPDFAYISDEAERLKKRLERDTVSLNKKVREAERLESEARRDKYEADRTARAKQVAGAGNANDFRVYALSLDNVDNPELVLESAKTREEMSGMRMAARAADDEEDPDANKYPYGVEPAKLECLRVIRDMIELQNGAPATARSEDKK